MGKNIIYEKFSALLSTGRVANLPTVWSNVLIAFFLSSATSCSSLFTILMIASLIYIGGCMLGDALDADFDKIYRTSRPIPQGVISADFIKILGFFLLTLAAVLLASYDLPKLTQITGSVLLTLVISYAYFHEKSKLIGLPLMAFCRFMLVLFAASAGNTISAPWIWLFAAAIGLHTLFLTWVASTESSPKIFHARKLLPLGMIAVPLLSFPLSYLEMNLLTGAEHLIFLSAYFLWLFYTLKVIRLSKPLFVSRSLAAFCLLDASFAAVFSPKLAFFCLGLFVFSLLLQKIMDAT